MFSRPRATRLRVAHTKLRGPATIVAAAMLGRTINKAGDERACGDATTKDEKPPNGCGAMLRVDVIPIPDAPALQPERTTAPDDEAVATQPHLPA